MDGGVQLSGGEVLKDLVTMAMPGNKLLPFSLLRLKLYNIKTSYALILK